MVPPRHLAAGCCEAPHYDNSAKSDSNVPVPPATVECLQVAAEKSHRLSRHQWCRCQLERDPRWLLHRLCRTRLGSAGEAAERAGSLGAVLVGSGWLLADR